MRRPTSDVRHRESRRSSVDNANTRRRNSSVPYHTARLERNPNSLDSDTDFLCDRVVEFMESGDIYSIVTVELAEHSMYFERLLRYHKSRGYIRLPEFLNSGFISVLEFIRKGTTELTPDNVYDIFIAADYLLVPRLKQECANLLQNVANDPSTAIALWLGCRSLYWPEVGSMAFRKILENFESNWSSSEFLQLEAVDVWHILQEDGLNCKREKNVFEAVQTWINVSPKTRMQHALDLLLCVRIGMLTGTELEQIKKHDIIKCIPEYQTLLNDWPKCLADMNNPIVSVCGKLFFTPRLPHEVVLVFGGWCDGEGPRAAAQIYNPRANTWTLWTEAGAQAQPPWLDWLDKAAAQVADSPSAELTSNDQSDTINSALEIAQVLTAFRNSLIPDGPELQPDISVLDISGSLIGEIPRRVYAGCVLIGTRVYLVGGFDGTNALKSTLCYDFEIDSGWYEISCMYEKRYYVSVAYALNHIYALGGHNGENQGRLDTAERYQLDENLWQTIASMNRVRSDAAAAELNDRVYVAGGFEGRRYHDSAEYYEPDTNQWTLVSRMHSPRGGISLVQQGGFLYAIGGNDGNSRLRSIERYDSNEGKWELVGQMNRRKSNLSSTVVNDDIYILGGWSDEPEAGILDLVERFDTTTRECHVVRSLTFPASATCACTLKNRSLVKKYIRPLPSEKSCNSGPEFGLFHNPQLGSDLFQSLGQQSISTSLNNNDGMQINGQRNTNNQPSTKQKSKQFKNASVAGDARPDVVSLPSTSKTASLIHSKRMATDEDSSECTSTGSEPSLLQLDEGDIASTKRGSSSSTVRRSAAHNNSGSNRSNRRLRSPLCSPPKRGARLSRQNSTAN